jgi:predicted Zn-dependent protease with MMP-like domain
MDRETFENLVESAWGRLPEEAISSLQNVAICVEDDSEAGDKLGEYLGVPRLERWGDDSGLLPDKIVLYRLAICEECEDDPEAIAEEIRRTLWHEIAHHLGWGEEMLEGKEIEKGWR